MRFINPRCIIAAQLTTPAENPLVSDDTRLMDIWFGGPIVRKQFFKKVKKVEQESLAAELTALGFIRSGNLLLNPDAVLFAEMEHELVGGLITIGFQDNGRPVELKVNSGTFNEISARLSGKNA